MVLAVICFMNALYIFSYFQRIAIPGTIYNDLQSSLNLTSVQIALLGGICLYVYGGMQIFSGIFSDRFGPSKVIVVGGILLGLGSVLFPLSKTVSQLYITRFIVGLGAGLIYLPILKELDLRFSDKHFSIMLSATILLGYFGGLMGTKPFRMAADSLGWRNALLFVGAASLATALLTAIFTKGSQTGSKQTRPMPVMPAIKRIARNKMCYPVIFSMSAIYANYFLMQSVIGKKFLEDCCHMSSGRAANYIFFMMLASMIASTLSGLFSTFIGNRRKPVLIAVSIISLMAVGTSMLIHAASPRWALLAYVLFGISSCGSPIFTASMKELNEPSYAGSALGIMNSILYLLVAGLVIVSGFVMGRFPAVRMASAVHYSPEAYSAIFLICLVFALLALVSAFFIRETSGCNVYELCSDLHAEDAVREHVS